MYNNLGNIQIEQTAKDQDHYKIWASEYGKSYTGSWVTADHGWSEDDFAKEQENPITYDTKKIAFRFPDLETAKAYAVSNLDLERQDVNIKKIDPTAILTDKETTAWQSRREGFEEINLDLSDFDMGDFPYAEMTEGSGPVIEMDSDATAITISGDQDASYQYGQRIDEWVNSLSEEKKAEYREAGFTSDQMRAMAAYIEENNFSRGEKSKAWTNWRDKVRDDFTQYEADAKETFSQVWRYFYPLTVSQIKEQQDITARFGEPSEIWNPQGQKTVTLKDKAGNPVDVTVPNWGQKVDHLITTAKPAQPWPDSYPVVATEDTQSFIESEYGEKLDTLNKFKAWKKDAIGWKRTDEYTFWMAWVTGYMPFNRNGILRFHNWQNYDALYASHIVDAWRFKYYKNHNEASRKIAKGELQPQFCTGNYWGWLKKYRNNKWFKLAIDTVTTWVYLDKNKVVVKTPSSYQYSPATFWGYSFGAFDSQDPKGSVTGSAAFAPFPEGGEKAFTTGRNAYINQVSGYPTKYPYTTFLSHDAYHLDGFRNDPQKQLFFALHYLIKYPQLEKIPAPPFHTKPNGADYQFLANILNANRYVNTILRSGMKADSGDEKPEGISYLPALEPPEEGDILDSIKTALEKAAKDIVEVHLDVFKLMTFGTTDTGEWIKRASIAASVASMVSGMPLGSEGAKQWFKNKALEAIAGKVAEEAKGEVIEQTYGSSVETEREEQQEIVEDAEEKAEEIQEDISESEQQKEQADESVPSTGEQLTALGKKAIVPGSILALILLGGG